jgi:MoaA/NifB/PqqE/SkfB family radical SAM enzyme
MKPTTILEVWTTCHVNCTFCYKEYDKNKENYFKSIEQVRDEIKTLSKRSSHILLAWWEPALYPNLIELLDECKKYNLTVCLVTIWDKLKDEKFLDSILDVWVITSIQVSIHTLDESEWKELYWVPWIVEKQIKWIELLVNKWNIKFWINIVMNKININSIWNTIIWLNKLWAEIFYISAIHIFSWITKSNILTTVSYIKIKRQLDMIKELLSNNEIKLALKSFPLCVHKYLKNYIYEIRELNVRDSVKTNNTWITDWEEKKKFKTKLKECTSCYAYWKKCFWPYEYYVKIYWDKEFSNLSEDDYNKMVKYNCKNVW